MKLLESGKITITKVIVDRLPQKNLSRLLNLFKKILNQNVFIQYR
jgi:hypothetical protein